MRRIPGEQHLADHLTKGKAWHQIEMLIRGVGEIMKVNGDTERSNERTKEVARGMSNRGSRAS